MSDNGFGKLENSTDYHLRVYTLRPDFKTAQGGSGQITVEGFFELTDPNKHIPFAITNEFTLERILTGADFDLESFRKAPDGTFWFGDEFGPFLLHTDAQGVVLAPPIPLPDFDNPGQEIRAPQNPLNEEGATVRIMNAVRRHAQLQGNQQVPIFSPYHAMLNYQDSDINAHYARGNNPQPGLTPAASDVFDVRVLQRAGYPIIAWTVNDKARMLTLLKLGINGIISDRPDILWAAVEEYDATLPAEQKIITAEGLIDIKRFDAQGHRGSRDLRPENTLPAMEIALDYLMTTLETDSAVTQEGTAMINHDPYIENFKCRRTDGQAYTEEVLIKTLTVEAIQNTFICDLNPNRGDSQQNDPQLSPVTQAFIAAQGLPHAYVMPTVQQLFDFVNFYVAYYQKGAGQSHPQAQKRWRNAAQVHFNIEPKTNPRTDKDIHGHIYQKRTVSYEQMAKTLAQLIVDNELTSRVTIQSFDFRTLLWVQQHFPQIRTVYLFGDFPIFEHKNSDDGTNLQDQNGANTPWLAGLSWPYRVTRLTQPFRARSSGGFEGMAITPDGKTLLPLLEKPLKGEKSLLIHEFDLETQSYTGVRYRYPLAAQAIGDFTLYSPTEGFIIERDNSQGKLDGFKRIYKIVLKEWVEKTLAVDLLNIADPHHIAVGQPGDVGIEHPFAFPFVTIESVVVLKQHRLGVLNDNNFPFSIGRHVGSGQPDDNEFILLELDPRIFESKR